MVMEVKVNKQLLILEHHCLLVRYSHLRIRKPNEIEKLMSSIERYGQLAPVVVVPEVKNQWVLIDGYLRVQALKRLGRDTIETEVWSCDISEALVMVLKHHQARGLEVFEEALFLQELHNQFGLSQNLLSERIGRDKSWVSRRLSLLEFLPENILAALSDGKISVWTATRVLTPLARANTLHAEQLLKYLLKNAHNTRDMRLFYEHYQQSNRMERSRMVNEAGLFFKAQRFLKHEKHCTHLKNGPEGKWGLQCRAIHALLLELMALAPTIFDARQAPKEYKKLVLDLNRVRTQFDELTDTIKRLHHASEGSETNHYPTSSKWDKQACHQPIA